MARVGILGGTFNPPHLGHLALAQHARAQLGLSSVHLIPAHTSPHKLGERDPGPEHRARMCALLVQDAQGLSVCRAELERGGTSYTVDTLREIHACHPGTELTLIAGADSARGMPSWREADALFELADLAVAARAGTDRREVSDALAPLLGRATLTFLSARVLDVSSSTARERAAGGRPIAELVGERVAGYVAEHCLYENGALAS